MRAAVASSVILGALLFAGTALADGHHGEEHDSLQASESVHGHMGIGSIVSALNANVNANVGAGDNDNDADQDHDGGKKVGSTTPHVVFRGSGQPVVGGTITAVGSSTVTITNKSNVTYTVNTASTTVVKGKTASNVSVLAVGDNVLVQGAVNGTSITASSILDAGATASTTKGHGLGHLFGGLGHFLRSLFGFF